MAPAGSQNQKRKKGKNVIKFNNSNKCMKCCVNEKGE